MEEKKKPTEQENTSDEKKDQNWIEKTEAKIDETAEKIHKSEAYHKADKKLFRKAGRLWGKL